MYTYAGNIHIHSSYSDGSGTINQIAAAASVAGISYIIITDHETLQGLPEEGFRHGVAVLVGAELNRNCCHYLALGLNEVVERNEECPQEIIERVRDLSGIGFIAHPFERGSPYIDGGRSYPWTNWPVENFTGLEIWNYSSHWRGRADSISRALYWFIFNRNGAMDGPPGECLQLWDCFTGHGRRVVGIGGTDAHAARRRFGFIPLVIFPYEFLFRTINTYICLENPLSKDFEPAKKQIYAALREGRCYISYDRLHSGRGFSFSAACPAAEQAAVLMGDEITLKEGLYLDVHSPARRSLIRLICNGKLSEQHMGREVRFKVLIPGVYRVEVFYRPFLGRPRPWICSNPIYVRG